MPIPPPILMKHGKPHLKHITYTGGYCFAFSPDAEQWGVRYHDYHGLAFQPFSRDPVEDPWNAWAETVFDRMSLLRPAAPPTDTLLRPAADTEPQRDTDQLLRAHQPD